MRDTCPEEADALPAAEPEEAEAEPAWFGLYWSAWEALRFDRIYGAMGGETPIPYAAISRYARDHGITSHDFGLFRRLLTAVDAAWLDVVAERQDQENKER